MNLTLSQIYKITQNFSKDHIIGVGGFGSVYKAELSNGRIVAIKRAKKVLSNFYFVCYIFTCNDEYHGDCLKKIDNLCILHGA